MQDLTVIQAQKYHDLIDNAIQAAIGGESAQDPLSIPPARRPNRVTKQIGVDRQRDVYQQFKANANAYR